MKNIKDYEEEIYKCSRCGLCQYVCPVFRATLNECAVSRGKFNILNGIIKGDLSFTKKVKAYLDLCTGCNACKDFCPSQINAKEIFIAAKSEYYQKNKISFWEKICNSYFVFKFLLVSAKILFNIYRFSKLDKIINLLESQIIKKGILGKRIVLMNSLAGYQLHKNKKNNSTNKSTQKALYFAGCFNQYINPQTEDAVLQILAQHNIEFIKKDFECCGVSYLNDGNIEQFKKLININLSKIDCDFDYIITDCASCYDVLKQYTNFNNTELARKVSEKTINVTQLIKNMDFISDKNLKVAVHKPCHDDYEFIKIIKNIKNITYKEAVDFDKCCGFSGKFALQNQSISRKISKQKALHYIESNADMIITTCPACLLGLNQGLAEINMKHKPKVLNLFVFLSSYCKPYKN